MSLDGTARCMVFDYTGQDCKNREDKDIVTGSFAKTL